MQTGKFSWIGNQDIVQIEGVWGIYSALRVGEMETMAIEKLEEQCFK